MRFVGLGFATRPKAELGEAFKELWASPELRREAVELLEVLADRARRPTFPLAGVPFHIHATYSRDEISAGLGQIRKGKLLRTQGRVYCDEGLRSDSSFFCWFLVVARLGSLSSSNPRTAGVDLVRTKKPKFYVVRFAREAAESSFC